MKKLLLIGFVLLGWVTAFAQDPELVRLQAERERLQKEIVAIEGKIEGRKLANGTSPRPAVTMAFESSGER